MGTTKMNLDTPSHQTGGASDGSFLTIDVVDWNGPIVELGFNRPINNEHDADAVVREAHTFMRTRLAPRARKAYFVTCYDDLVVSPKHLERLREGFLGFNAAYSLGDVRYGGAHFAKTFIISAAVRAAERSNIHPDRESALKALRDHIRADRHGGRGQRRRP
jgi:hypothetical protein